MRPSGVVLVLAFLGDQPGTYSNQLEQSVGRAPRCGPIITSCHNSKKKVAMGAIPSCAADSESLGRAGGFIQT